MNGTKKLKNAGELSFMGLESVCGTDTRYKVWQTNTVPYYHACHLRITFDEGVYVGSAFPVIRDDNKVVFATSGHCVYANGKFANKIVVTPARNVNEKPYGTFTVESDDLRASDKWKASGVDRGGYDYGAIIVSPVTDIDALAMTVLTDDELQDRIISNCGYPADKPYGTMWWCGGPIDAIEDRMLRYMADTYGGQSGSPIYTWCDDNIFRAVGIHGYGGCPNGAVRITDGVMADFEAWSS